MVRNKNIGGYLPLEWPGFAPTLLLGFQHFLAIFPATVLVPVLTGFNVSATLFASGCATLAALVVTRFRVPLYYGSSFSAIAAVMMVVKANGGGDVGVSIALVGIAVAGVTQILVGLLIVKMGPQWVVRVLPAGLQGSVAMIIAYALSSAAIDMASGMCCLVDQAGKPIASLTWWTVAFVTFLAVVFWTWRLRSGLLGMLPILGGGFVGYLVAIPLGLVNFAPVFSAEVVRPPHLVFPAFGNPAALAAVLSIVPVVIATIPESLAHFYQVRIAIKDIAKRHGKKAEDIEYLVGRNIVGDGLGDVITGMLGGAMGTNYGETIATIIASGAATVFAVMTAAILGILSGFSGHLEALVETIPTAVTGGLAIYMFAAFGIVGIKMLLEAGDLLEPKNVAIVSVVLILGIGGGNKYGGSLPVPLPPGLDTLLPGGVPAIAAAALSGILLNTMFTLFPTAQDLVERRAAPVLADASDPVDTNK